MELNQRAYILIFPSLLSGFGIQHSDRDSTVRPANGGEFHGVNGGLHRAREGVEAKYFGMVGAFIVEISCAPQVEIRVLGKEGFISELRVVRVPTVGRFEEDIISDLWLYEYHDIC
jgi:hypothetical protein